MTVTQVPGRDDQLLATCKFFSPNFGGDDARIVSYTRSENGAWHESTLCDLPYVHRFGVLEGADGRLWLLACTIKGACRKVKNDWQTPGAVFMASKGRTPNQEGTSLSWGDSRSSSPSRRVVLSPFSATSWAILSSAGEGAS